MPNWVSNVLVLKPEDCKKIEEFMEMGKNEDNPRLDFEKIIPVPETVYRGDVSLEKNSGKWCAPNMSLEEFREKYPGGDWYNWQLNNWGTKWNACETYYNPAEEGDEYGTLEFQTAWDLPTPVMLGLHVDKKVDFVHYYTEESNAFIGAYPYTNDTKYPMYLDDPEGEDHADEIYRFVNGEGQYDWILAFPSERIDHFINYCHTVLTKIKTGHKNLTKSIFLTLVGDAALLTQLCTLLKRLLENQWRVESADIEIGDSREFAVLINDIETAIEKLHFTAVERNSETEGMCDVHELQLVCRYVIQELRSQALDMSVGLSRERANSIIQSWVRSEVLEEHRQASPVKVNVDSVLGRRFLFGHLLSKYSSESLTSKLDALDSLPETLARDIQSPQNIMGRNEIISMIDTAKAMLELYDELGSMSSDEFMRLMQNYVKTNLFQLAIERVETIDKNLREEVQWCQRRINVVRFKNQIHTGRQHHF